MSADHNWMCMPTPIAHTPIVTPHQHRGSVLAAATCGFGPQQQQQQQPLEQQKYGNPAVFSNSNNSSGNNSAASTPTADAKRTVFTHSPYAANVIGPAAEPVEFAVVGRRRRGSATSISIDAASFPSGRGSSANSSSSSSSESGNTPRSDVSATTPTGPTPAVAAAPAFEFCGRIEQMARTAHGCTTLQNSLKGARTALAAHAAISAELRPHYAALLFDQHAAYVVRLLISQMPRDDASALVHHLCADAEWVCALATHSLHSRRVVQFFAELLLPSERAVLLRVLHNPAQLMRLALTENGCVAVQRLLDAALPAEREAAFDTIRACLGELAQHQHGNYVVQYLLRHGDAARNSQAVVAAFAPRIVDVACDKFSSNVLERALDQITAPARAALVDALYASPQWQLQRLLTDGVGNYIVQASIAHCNAQQLAHVVAQLAPLLPLVAYGGKIEAKLNARAQALAAMQPRYY